MQFGLFSNSQVVGCVGQRLQGDLFQVLKLSQGALFCRTVRPLPGCRQTPGTHILVGLDQARGFPPAQEVAFDVVNATLFYLAFVLWGLRSAGRYEKAVVFRAFPVSQLWLWVFPTRLGNAGFEIINDDAPRNAAEKGEGVAVQA